MKKKPKNILIETLCAAYDFFARNPGASAYDLASEFSLPQSTGRSRARALAARGCVTSVLVKNHRNQSVESYSIVDGRRPDGNTTVNQEFYDARLPNAEFRRVFKPAVQIGMPAYADLPSEFFGQVVSA